MLKLRREQKVALVDVLSDPRLDGQVHISQRNGGSIQISAVKLIGGEAMGWYETQFTYTIRPNGEVTREVFKLTAHSAQSVAAKSC